MNNEMILQHEDGSKLTDTEMTKLGRLLVSDATQGQEAELEQKGALSGFAKTEIMGLPIGKAGVALLTVSVWDALRGLLGGVLPAAIPAWLIPAVGAVVVQSKMIKGFMGTDAANAAGLILTADAIQALFNVRGLVSGLVSGVSLGQKRGNTIYPAGEPDTLDSYLKAKGLA